MSGTHSETEISEKDRRKRKRARGTKVSQEADESTPGSKKVSPYVESDSDSIVSAHGLVIAESEQDDNDTNKSPSPDSIDNLPMEALIASTLTQFSSCIRPSLMVAYPAATSAEINAITNAKWKCLKEARRKQAGNLSKRPKTQNLSQTENESESRPKRRAAKNISSGSYLEEYMESPISDDDDDDDDEDEAEYVGVADKKEQNGRPSSEKMGRTRASSRRKKVKRFPKIKLKMIRRSEENSIFLAQSMDDSEDSKEGIKSVQMKSEQNSETSSLHFEEEEDDSGTRDSSVDNQNGEDNEEDDSEGEHKDFCSTCKDGGELLCCDKCPSAYHLECVFPPLKNIPVGEWICQKCTAEELPSKIERLLTWRWIVLPPGEEVDDDDEDDIIDKPVIKSPNVKRGIAKMREFFVKWEGKSYWKCSWVSEIRIDVHQHQRLRVYMQTRNMEVEPILELPPHQERRRRRRSSFYDEKMEEMELMLLKLGVRPEWLQVHRIINSKPHKSGTKFLVKWRELGYDKVTWELLDDASAIKGTSEAIKQYERLRTSMESSSKKKKGRGKGQKIDPKKKYTEQPEFISATGGTLHPYQLEGINWLRFSWAQRTNTILADEMGLGKTIQTISFLYSLVKEGINNGPFLISAPLSTIINWEREFEFWAPDLYVVTYTGYKDGRQVIRENEFSFVEGAIKHGSSRYRIKKDAPLKFHVLLTSYEFVSVDATILKSIDWSVLVVDEAHRLKNNQSKFFKVLSQYQLKYKLLLTGTPLQNNLEELFHLLNFLSPESFSSLEDFQETFADISKEDQIKKLHEMLGPHLLRRLKSDVLKNMPSKYELIVRVELTATQKKYYKWILTKNYEKLNVRGSKSMSLMNIMMDLKKCCNHPYMFPVAAEEAPIVAGGYYEGKALINSCGKLVVMEKMLKKLKKQGHRVLIFSQMTKLLDILEDFLEYLGYKYERIDGAINGSERQLSIDRFNAPGAKQFCFLLSTRAGGLGINLATADTVIIYDSDWNPHNDIQALSRAHRIGQANKVMIYRFVTRNSVEERVCEVAKRKMMLTHLIVRSGFGTANQPSLSKRELDDILKFGTEELFKDEQSSNEQDGLGIVYDDKAIDNLLDRSQEAPEEKGPLEDNLLANQYLGQFKVASYVMKEKVEPEPEIIQVEETAQPSDPDFWEKLLRHHYEQQRELEGAKLGKGKRIRKQVNYHDGMSADLSELKGEHEEGDESAYSESDNEVSEEESDDEVEFEPGSRKIKIKRSFKSDIPPLLTKVNDTIVVYGFNPRQRRTFLNQVLRFGMPPANAHNISWMPKELRSKPEPTFSAYVSSFMKHLCEPDMPHTDIYSDGVPKNGVSRQNILARIGILKLIQNKINQYKDINGEYSLLEDVPLDDELVEPSSTAVVTVDKTDDVVAMETDVKATPTDKPVKESMEVETPPTLENNDNNIPKTEVEVVNVQEQTTKNDNSEMDSEPVIVSVTKSSKHKQKLKFNIADGGFTELHSMWAQEKTDRFDSKRWGRHHDYWLLKGITVHGFCRWTEICADPRFSIVNKPFLPEESTDTKNRFLLRRYKLLEQALAVEEQLHRASNAGLHQNPNDNVMQLHSRFTDLDCLADGHQMLIKECLVGDKNAIMLMRKALGKMEELLLDMKSDVSKLSMELTKIPPVSNQLKIDEMSILGKLAGKDSTRKLVPILPSTAATVSQPSVITQAKPVVAKTEVHKTVQQQLKPSSLSVKTNDKNLIILSNNTTASSALQFIQQKPQTTAPTSQYATINMAQYAVADGTTLLMPAQSSLPVGTQQVLYWAPGQVVQSSQGGTILAQASGTPGNQTSILTQPSSQTALVTQQHPGKSVGNIQFINTKVLTDSSGAKVIHIE